MRFLPIIIYDPPIRPKAPSSSAWRSLPPLYIVYILSSYILLPSDFSLLFQGKSRFFQKKQGFFLIYIKNSTCKIPRYVVKWLRNDTKSLFRGPAAVRNFGK